MKLKRKMSLFFIFALIIPVVLMLMVLLNQNVSNIRDVNKNEVEKTVALVNKISKQELEKGFVSLDYLKSIYLNQEDGYKLNNALYDIRRNSPNFLRVYIVNEETGELEAYPKDGKIDRKIFSTEWYKEARSQSKLIYTNSAEDKNYVVTVSKSLVKNGKIVGVVAVDIDLELVFAELQNRKSRSLSEYVILDSNTDQIIFPKVTSFSPEFINELVNNDGTIGKTNTVKANNNEMVSYYKEHVDGTSWILAGTSSLSALKVTYNASRNILYVSIAIIAFLSIFSVIVFDNLMINPLVQVKDKFKQASTGNFGTRIFVDSNDEIGDLADEFNALMKKINKKFRTMESGMSKGLTKSQIAADIELDDAMGALEENIQVETMIPKYDFSSSSSYKRREAFENRASVKVERKYDNISELEEEAFDNPIVEEDENFQKHQRELIHRTFDEWRTEYFKTLEEKKKENVSEVETSNSILDEEPEELV